MFAQRAARTSLALLTLCLTFAIAGAGAVSAAAEPEQAYLPPIVNDESIKTGGVSQHGYYNVRPNLLANDRDPNGGSLTLCGISNPREDAVSVQPGGRSPSPPGLVTVTPHLNETATYEITYSVCNEQLSTEGTLTINIFRIDPVEVRLVSPGRLEFSNPGTRQVTVTYGRVGKDQCDGRFDLAAGTSAVVTVHRSSIAWYAYHRAYPAGTGRVEETGATDHGDVPRLRAEAIAPHQVRFTNPSDLRARVTYGKPPRYGGIHRVDGTFTLAGGKSTVVRTDRNALAYRSKAPYGLSLGLGRVRTLPHPRMPRA